MARDTERKRLTRRQFVRLAAATGLGTALASCGQEQVLLTPGATAVPPAIPTATPMPPQPTAAGAAEPPTQPPSGPSPEPALESPPEPTAETPAEPTLQPEPSPVPAQAAYLSVARGVDPRAITHAALARFR